MTQIRGQEGSKAHAYECESRLGERAPIPRDSFVVPSNCGLPSPSKLFSPGAGRGMGTSRSGGARSLLRGLRQPDPRPTTGNIGKNCGAGRGCLRLVGRTYRSGSIPSIRPTYKPGLGSVWKPSPNATSTTP